MAGQPNLLFLMPDQLRADFLSCYGAEFIDTPNIDRLAREGVRYENAYTPSPICVPARALLLPGRNAIKNGVLTNNQFLRPDLGECGIHTWPEILGGAGYETSAIGKMHFYPWDISMGFQHRIVAEDKRWLLINDDYQKRLKSKGYRKLHGDEHEGYQENRGAIVHKIPWELSWDHFVGSEAARHIRDRDNGKPFAMMVGFPGPHCPYDPSLEYLEQFDPDDMPDAVPLVEENVPHLRRQNVNGNRQPWNGVDYTEFTAEHKKKIRVHYAALVKQIDDEVGDILKALNETGELENTVIVFASDHGDHLGDHGLIGKGDFYESSIKVPLIVRPQGGQAGSVHTRPVSIGDIPATLLALAGCEVPSYMDAVPLPGLDIPTHEREYLFGLLASGCMVFDGEWKMVKYASGDVLLFNLKEDPQEQENCAADEECQGIYLRLDAALSAERLRSIYEAHSDKVVAHFSLYDNEEFGNPGWKRRYPETV